MIFTHEMVEKKEDLSNAIALNSSMVNSARLLGPSLAGILIASVGEGICFLLNCISYLAAIAALAAMKIAPRDSARNGSLRSGCAWRRRVPCIQKKRARARRGGVPDRRSGIRR